MGSLWDSVKSFFEETEEQKAARLAKTESRNVIEQMVLKHNQEHNDKLSIVHRDTMVGVTAHEFFERPTSTSLPFGMTCITMLRSYKSKTDLPFTATGKLCPHCGNWHIVKEATP